ncbi:uncharacterized protein LOC128955623 [Oppia nitens]|uniref:uncharacterized protein LOC128955623 n=1 Tax=Oppia nitens TaxID=1686743 RepID=UPI0023DC26F6|nr:uncharacterized protein LOC128955623 [Oppia nitens]
MYSSIQSASKLLSLLLYLLIGISITNVLAAYQYPNVRRDDKIEDNFWGKKLKDPYRWLEDPDSNETKKFVNDQNGVTQPYVKKNKNRDQITKNFKDIYNYPKYGVPFKKGNKYYYWANTGLLNQNVYYSADSLTSEAKVFLDPNQLSADGTTSLHFISFSKDGKYCAYGISKGGSDWITIKIKDTQTLKDLPETLTKIKFSSTAWTHDNLGFFYAYYDEYTGPGEGTDPKPPENQKLYYHKINTNQDQDIMITKFPEHPKWLIGTPIVSDDGKYVHIFPQEGTSTVSWFFAKLSKQPINQELPFTPVKDKADAEYFYVTSDDNLVYMRTNRNAAKFRVVRVDLNQPDESNWEVILPEHEISVLNDVVAVNKNYMAVIYMRDVVHIIEIHRLSDGQYLWDVDTPIGTVNGISGDRDGKELFYKISSFLSPGVIYRYDFNTNPNTISIFKESKVQGLDITEFETNQVFFKSKDETVRVPMFLVHRKNIKLDGSNPTLLYAYGGFNINIEPGYDPLATFFIKHLNGVYALANIRGGGEYGESWHESGMKLKKQNVFDDFASAAQWLINNKYTRKDRLTINGRSNGGLLVGAVSNQRPDIIGCSLANVGVMDMIRFPNFTVGWAWTEEYGNPQTNQTEFEYILKYSPLHSIIDVPPKYPAMLVLTADHDDRVVPAHSYKFIAQLQYQLGNKLPDTPLMIRIDTNSGHGAGKPISKWIEEYTDIVSFILNSLNIDYPKQPIIITKMASLRRSNAAKYWTQSLAITVLALMMTIGSAFPGFLSGSAIKSLYNFNDPDIRSLTDTNFTHHVYDDKRNSGRVQLIQFYNSWCGHCIAFAPTFKELARQVRTWRQLLAIRVVDCAQDINTKLCRDMNINVYPTLKMYWFNPKHDDKGVELNTDERSSDGIQKGIIKWMGENWSRGVPRQWPDLMPVAAESKERFIKLLPIEKGLPIVLIIENEKSYLGRQVILDLNKYQSSVTVLRMLESTDTLIKEILPEPLNNYKLPIMLSITNKDYMFKLLSKNIYSDKDIRSEFIRIIKKQFVSNSDDLDTDREVSVQQLAPNKQPEDSSVAKIMGSIESPTTGQRLSMVDLNNALRNSLFHEVALKKTLNSTHLNALKNYLTVLELHFPFQSNKMQTFVKYLNEWLSKKRVTDVDVEDMLATMKTYEEYYHFPEMKPWSTCAGSDAKYRGYPCSMWTMFHTLTVAEYKNTLRSQKWSTLHSVLYAMRDYIKNYFGCTYCAKHFQEMSTELESTLTYPNSSVLWLWRAHNRVNKRLHGDPSEDPKHPKQQYPTREDCAECYDPNGQFVERNVFEFLLRHYSADNIVKDESELKAELRADSVKSGDESQRSANTSIKAINVFNNMDYSLLLILYISSAAILLTICVYLKIIKRRRGQKYNTLKPSFA